MGSVGRPLIQNAVGDGMKLKMDAMSNPGGDVRKPSCDIWSRVFCVFMLKNEALSRGGGDTVNDDDLLLLLLLWLNDACGLPEMFTSSPSDRINCSMSLLDVCCWSPLSSSRDIPDMVINQP